MVRTGLRALVVLLSVAACAAYVLAALRQAPLPQPADPVEAALLERAELFAHHQAAYGEPVGSKIAPVMPGLPLAASFLGGDAGPDLRTLRGLALVLALLLAAMVVVAVRVETASWTLALAGGSFALVGQGFRGAGAGVAQPVTAMLILAITAFVVLRATTGVTGALAAAVLLGLAFFIDQRAGWFLLAALAVLALEDRGQLTAFVLGVGLIVGGGYVLLSRLLGPWFNYDAWDVPLALLRPSLEPVRLAGGQLFGTLGCWTLAALLYCGLPSQPLSGKGGAWLMMTAAAVGSGVLSTQGGGVAAAALPALVAAAFLPALVALAVLGPVAMQRVTRHLAAWPGSERHEGESVLLAAVVLQFAAVAATIPVERWLG